MHPGESHRVAVVESRGRRGVWRVRVDGRPVSAPLRLPGSQRTWRQMATAESWNAGTRSCNRFAFSFTRLQVAERPGRWHRLAAGLRLQDPGYRVFLLPAGFVARAR